MGLVNIKQRPCRAALIRGATLALFADVLLATLRDAYQVKLITNSYRVQGSNYANIFENPYLRSIAAYINQHDPEARAAFLIDANTPGLQLSYPGFLWPYGIHTLDGYANLYSINFRDYWRATIEPMMQAFPTCRYGLSLNHGETRLYLNNCCDVEERVDISNPGELFDFDLLALTGVQYVVTQFEIHAPEVNRVSLPDVGCGSTCTQYFLYKTVLAYPVVSTRFN